MPRKLASPFERPTRPERPPPAVRLLAPFAYLDEAGVMHGWLPGQIVGDAAVVAELIRRGAPLGAIAGRPHVGEAEP